MGKDMGYAPCTPSACMKVLEHYGIDCTGKKVVVIGRSLVVGKPAAMMLLKKNATVTVCHTRTVDMPSVVKEADIVVVAAGKAGVIDGNYLREGQIVIDVGINVNEEGKLCGDVNFEEAEKIVDAITPVPRGVGGVTTSILLEHVWMLQLYRTDRDLRGRENEEDRFRKWNSNREHSWSGSSDACCPAVKSAV